MKKLLISLSLIAYILFSNMRAMEHAIDDPMHSVIAHHDPTVPMHVRLAQEAIMAHLPPAPYGLEHNVPVLQQDPSKPFTEHGKSIETDDEGLPATILGESGLTWKNVRSEEATNCGYHALHKSIILVEALLSGVNVTEELRSPHSTLSRQLNDRSALMQPMTTWVHEIYTSRRAEVHRQLGAKVDLADSKLKDLRSALNTTGRTYVHMNDGHIKTEMLADEEMEKLIGQEEEANPELRGHLMVLTDQTVFTDPARVKHFQQAQNDTLAIMWTESGFNHWVTYVAHKVDGNVVVYKMNSINGSLAPHPARTPRFDQMVVDMLMPTTGTRLPTIPLRSSIIGASGEGGGSATTTSHTATGETDDATAALIAQFRAEHEQASAQRASLATTAQHQIPLRSNVMSTSGEGSDSTTATSHAATREDDDATAALIAQLRAEHEQASIQRASLAKTAKHQPAKSAGGTAPSKTAQITGAVKGFTEAVRNRMARLTDH